MPNPSKPLNLYLLLTTEEPVQRVAVVRALHAVQAINLVGEKIGLRLPPGSYDIRFIGNAPLTHTSPTLVLHDENALERLAETADNAAA